MIIVAFLCDVQMQAKNHGKTHGNFTVQVVALGICMVRVDGALRFPGLLLLFLNATFDFFFKIFL